MPAGAPPLAPSDAWSVKLFFLLAVLICAIGYFSYRYLKQDIQQQNERVLANLASLKVEQINNWITERKIDAAFLKRSHLGATLEEWLRDGAPNDQRRRWMLSRIKDLLGNNQYDEMMLLDTQGISRLSTADDAGVQDGYLRHLAKEAIRTREVMLSDLHWGIGGKPELDLVAPLLVGEGSQTRTVGAAYFHVDPSKFLFPLIQSWPLASNTAETLIVRREGDRALFLNELRYRHDPAMTVTESLSNVDLPATRAALGESGLFLGKDYLGHDVVSYLQHIPQTTWGMVAKIDEAEIYAPVQRVSVLIAGVVMALLLAVFLVLRSRQQRLAEMARQYQLQLEKQVLETRVHFLSKFGNDIILLADEQARLLDFNDRAVAAYGYSREELLQMNLRDLRPAEWVPIFENYWQLLSEKGSLVNEGLHRCKDGSTFPIEASSRRIESAGQVYIQSIVRDISEQKAAERRIRRLNSFYVAISEVNAAIVRNREQNTLFDEICHILVDHCQLKLAWVGLADEKTRSLWVVAGAGSALAYLDHLHISLDADLPEGQGPGGAAMRSGEAQICNDFLQESCTCPWHEAAVKQGIKASGTWPFASEGRVVGAITLYAEEIDYFDAELAELLAGISQDLSFAMENYARESRRLQAEAEVFKQRNFLHRIIDADPNYIMVTDASGKYLLVNKAMAAAYKMAPQEMVGRSRFEMNPVRQGVLYQRLDQAVIESRRQAINIVPFTTSDGEERWLLSIKVPLEQPDGEIHVLGVSVDITESKLAEDRLRSSEARLRTLVENLPHKIFMKDPNSVYTFCNSLYAEELGIPADQIVGKSDQDFYPKYLADKFRESDLGVIDMGETVDYQERYIQCGEEKFVHALKVPLKAGSNKSLGILGMFLDITERKRTERALLESEQRYRVWLDVAPVACIVWDPETYCIEEWNRMAETIFGWQRDEMVGRNFLELLVPEDERAKLRSEIDFRLRTGITTHSVGTNLTRSGHRITCEWLNAGLVREDGSPYAMMSVCTDITERMQLAAARNQHQSEMKRVERLKVAGEMASGLTHELSQPLSAANNYIDACLRRLQGGEYDADRQLQCLSLAHKQTERAGKIINHFKTLIRREEGERAALDVNRLIHSTVSFLENELERVGVEVDLALDALPEVVASNVEIEQVLVNLVKNAIEAMRDRPLRKLRLVSRVENRTVLVEVGDSGSGIPSAELEAVFEQFHTTKRDGLGLGLAICRTIINAHEGRIWASSVPGEGSTFSFNLPC